jgi:predicted nuclease of predicted toxin-antitoxin system
MKFLLDVGITPRLGQLLVESGHTYRYVPAHYSDRLPDSEIMEIARLHDEVLITHDLDFGAQLAFSGQNRPSIIIFRIHHINADVFYKILMTNWDNIESPLEAGALILIENTNVRIRLLPIK